MHSCVELIGPAEARAILAENRGNRPLAESRVKALASMILSGDWQTTHQGIAIAEDGRLLDGQHRLNAIIRAGVPVRIMVTRDMDAGTFAVMDRGGTRTLAQALREDGPSVEVASFITQVLNGWNHVGVTDAMKREILGLLRPEITRVRMAVLSRNKRGSASIMAAGVAQILAGVDPDYVAKVASAFNRLDPSMPPVAMVLARSIDTGRIGAHDRVDLFARSLVIFDPNRSENTRIQVKDTEAATRDAERVIRRAVETRKAAI